MKNGPQMDLEKKKKEVGKVRPQQHEPQAETLSCDINESFEVFYIICSRVDGKSFFSFTVFVIPEQPD